MTVEDLKKKRNKNPAEYLSVELSHLSYEEINTLIVEVEKEISLGYEKRGKSFKDNLAGIELDYILHDLEEAIKLKKYTDKDKNTLLIRYMQAKIALTKKAVDICERDYGDCILDYKEAKSECFKMELILSLCKYSLEEITCVKQNYVDKLFSTKDINEMRIYIEYITCLQSLEWKKKHNYW